MRHVTLAALALTSALALTVAAPALGFPGPGAFGIDGPGEEAKAVEIAAATAAAALERERRAERRRERLDGPFLPLRAKPDYGESGAQFGADRGGRAHEGQDMFGPSGTPLVAARDGIVVETGNDGGRGNYVAIHSREKGQTYVYLHMLRPAEVREGERVRAAQRVGQLGCTGSCFGEHLHFEVRRGRGPEGQATDPRPLLQRWPHAPR